MKVAIAYTDNSGYDVYSVWICEIKRNEDLLPIEGALPDLNLETDGPIWADLQDNIDFAYYDDGETPLLGWCSSKKVKHVYQYDGEHWHHIQVSKGMSSLRYICSGGYRSYSDYD